PAAAASGGAAGATVIRRIGGSEETAQERLVKKHLPAWVASGAVHLVVALALFFMFGGRTVEAQQSTKVLDTTAEKEPEDNSKDLTQEDPGLESNLDAAVPDLERIAEKTVDDIVTSDPIGVPDTRTEDTAALKAPGLIADTNTGGAPGDTGDVLAGGGMQSIVASGSFNGRSGATKSQLIRAGGGNEASERAVAAGLAWLARQQKPNGSWVFDGGSSGDTIASTGMSLLPFLAAGVTHKAGNKYQQQVERGLKYLISMQRSDGGFNGTGVTMYSHGLATTALNEAYGMTKDRNLLLRPAQSATNFIVAKQAEDGSWGYSPGSPGDTSIVGWQIQALKAAILTKDVGVPDRTITNAIRFLDKVSSGSRKAVYGYAGPNGAPATSLTSVGLLCRYYISKWGPGNAGLAEGVDGLMKRGPAKAPAKPDMYYYYYSTQVVHFADGPEWKDWNEGPMKNGKREGGMRDWLINLQEKKEGPNHGSWESDGAIIGGSCGRVGTTALSLLTLEVYYRHLPLYKRENAGGLKVLDGVK
ncbi:MAG TPA: prenyltransferase/squalene oxidase repeat-containing protein, partial [Urbifossiella sp.]